MKTNPNYLIVKTLCLFLFFICTINCTSQTTLIASNATWKYLDNGSNQGINWRTNNFNDSLWPSGAAELGFGDFPTTQIASGKIGYYFRKIISLSNPVLYSGYVLKIRRDDGIVVYINNTEVYRNNLPAGTISYNTKASAGCTDDGNTTYTVNLPTSFFVTGNNIVAAEIHNATTTSSDITFVLQLLGNPPACSTPNTNLSGADSIKTNSARIFWTSLSGVNSYNLKYRIKNSGSSYSNPINSLTTSVYLTNLLPSTTYEYILQSVCPGNVTSSYSSSKSFLTLGNPCITPNVNFFGTLNKTTTTTDIFWSPVSGAQSYNVRFRIRNVGASYSSPINTISASLLLSNLLPSTNYEFTVQSVCSLNLQSSVSPSGWFTTLAVPPSLSLLRSPYMTIPTKDSISIQWRTNISTNSQVKFGESALNLIDSMIDTISSTEHLITLKNLLPNTKYYYSIGSTSVTLQGDSNNFFYTAPAENNPVPLKFWVTGDFGNGSSVQTSVRNSFSNFVSGQKINGWLWLGDNAYDIGSDVEYQTKVFNVYESLLKNIPLFPAPGNHDYGRTGYQTVSSLGTNFPYFSIFNLPLSSGTEKYYSSNYGNVHFISLDSYGSFNNASSSMYQWLLNDLTNNKQHWTIVFFHHPPYSKGSHDSDIDIESLDMRNNIVPLLESFGVDLVLSGHSHNYERSSFIKNHYGLENTFNSNLSPAGNIIQNGGGPFFKTSQNDSGTVYLVCGVSGGIGISTSPGYPHDAMFQSINNVSGSLILDINADTLSCNFLISTGLINDQFSIIKTIPPFPKRNNSSSHNHLDNQVSLYPNPSDGNFYIKINNRNKTQVSISITDVNGKIIFSKSLLKEPDEDIYFDNSIEDLPSGIFLIKVLGDAINVSTRIIIY